MSRVSRCLLEAALRGSRGDERGPARGVPGGAAGRGERKECATRSSSASEESAEESRCDPTHLDILLRVRPHSQT